MGGFIMLSKKSATITLKLTLLGSFMLLLSSSVWAEKIGVLYIVHGGMETLTSENRGELMWNASITMFVYDHNHSVYKFVIWNPDIWPTVLNTEVTAMARKYQLMYDFAYDAIGNFDPFNTLTDGQAADLQAALDIEGASHGLEFEVEWAGWLGVDRIENFAYPRYVYYKKDDAVLATSNCTYCGELDKENVTLDFENGTAAFTTGATLSGLTSSATATIDEVTLTSGGWAGGDAAGYLLLSEVSETLRFQSGEPIVDAGTSSATAVGTTHWRNCDPERFNVDGSVERLLKKGVTRIIVVGMTMSGIRFLKGFQTVQLAKKCLEDWNNDHGTSIELSWINDPNNLMERSYPTEPEGWTRSLYEPTINPYVPLEGNPNPIAEDPQIAELHVDGIEAGFSGSVSDADTGIILTNHAIFDWCETFDPKINDTITVQENIKSMLLNRHPNMDPNNIVGAYGGGKEINPENGIFEYTREQRGDRLGTAYLYESDKQMPDYPWGFRYWEALEYLKERGVKHIVVGFPQVSTTSALDLTEIPNQIGKEIGIKTWAKWGTWDFAKYPAIGHPFADYWGVHMYTTCGPDSYSSTEYECCFEMGGCGDGRPYPALRQTPIDESRNEFDPSLVFDLSDYGHLGYNPAVSLPDPDGPVQNQYSGTWDMYEPPDDDPRLGPILAKHVLEAALSDIDNDTVADYTDNCPNVANPLQEDADSDSTGDVCDNNTVYGYVSGDIQAGVTVKIYTPNCGGDILAGEPVTNSGGYYSFGGLENGRYIFAVDYIGYSFLPVYGWIDIPQGPIQSYDFTATVIPAL
jgi:hypothetical protein